MNKQTNINVNIELKKLQNKIKKLCEDSEFIKKEGNSTTRLWLVTGYEINKDTMTIDFFPKEEIDGFTS